MPPVLFAKAEDVVHDRGVQPGSLVRDIIACGPLCDIEGS